VNGNAKIHIYYSIIVFQTFKMVEYWYSNRNIFCRCRGEEVIFDGSSPFISHLFSTGSALSIPHRKCVSPTVRGAACGGAEVSISGSNRERLDSNTEKSLRYWFNFKIQVQIILSPNKNKLK